MAGEAPNPKTTSLEVLILAPIGQDAHLLSSALQRAGIISIIFANIETVCTLLLSAGALLVSEEVLLPPAISQLNQVLDLQDSWSDIPIIVMTSGGKTTLPTSRVLKLFGPSGNITLIERPFRPMTLVSTLQVALRARKKQYQVRELLELQRQTMQAREEFISIASHELKTPLTSLQLQTEMAMRLRKHSITQEELAEKLMKTVESNHAQVKKLTRLVEDMLDLTRITSGKLSIQKTQFDLSELTLELVRNFQTVFATAKIEVHIDVDQGVVGKWDRFRVEQVINNLFTNVARYASGKPLWISVSQGHGRAILVVRDEGKGISPENQEKIFQRFERAAQPDDPLGLGLGLYISRNIVESHGGSMRVESIPGRGATFVVELPLTTEAVEASLKVAGA